MKELTNLAHRTLYLIENDRINFNRIHNRFNLNSYDIDRGYSNKNSIFWFSLNSTAPTLYTKVIDESDMFDYMHKFIRNETFDFIRKVHISSDLKFYDAHRAIRTKKNKSRTLKDTKWIKI